jgi:tRNA U34 5-carboxymethylaminomethyl modifying GTPase MnmE/TrmE
MTAYAKVDRASLEILARENKENPNLVDDPRKPKWVPLVYDKTRPVFDEDKELLEQKEIVSLDRVEIVWKKRNLSAKARRERIRSRLAFFARSEESGEAIESLLNLLTASQRNNLPQNVKDWLAERKRLRRLIQ